MNTATLARLRAARTYLTNPDHWLQGAMRNDDCVCIVGALMFTTDNGKRLDAKMTALTDSAMRNARAIVFAVVTNSRGTNRLEEWNDNAATTHNDVLVALDNAISALRLAR